MKRSVMWGVLLLSALVFGPAFAQKKPDETGPARIQGPVSGALAQNSNLHSLNLRLRRQMRQIQKDLRAGKITKIQAKAAWEKLKTVRRQELDYFRRNGQKEITADQKNQLNTTLDENSGI